jgi:hypothetical protein
MKNTIPSTTNTRSSNRSRRRCQGWHQHQVQQPVQVPLPGWRPTSPCPAHALGGCNPSACRSVRKPEGERAAPPPSGCPAAGCACHFAGGKNFLLPPAPRRHTATGARQPRTERAHRGNGGQAGWPWAPERQGVDAAGAGRPARGWCALLARARELKDLAGAEHAHLERGARRHAGQPVADLLNVVLRHNRNALD